MPCLQILHKCIGLVRPRGFVESGTHGTGGTDDDDAASADIGDDDAASTEMDRNKATAINKNGNDDYDNGSAKLSSDDINDHMTMIMMMIFLRGSYMLAILLSHPSRLTSVTTSGYGTIYSKM